MPQAFDAVWDAVRAHAGGEPRDDLALLLLERLLDEGGRTDRTGV